MAVAQSSLNIILIVVDFYSIEIQSQEQLHASFALEETFFFLFFVTFWIECVEIWWFPLYLAELTRGVTTQHNCHTPFLNNPLHNFSPRILYSDDLGVQSSFLSEFRYFERWN